MVKKLALFIVTIFLCVTLPGCGSNSSAGAITPTESILPLISPQSLTILKPPKPTDIVVFSPESSSASEQIELSIPINGLSSNTLLMKDNVLWVGTTGGVVRCDLGKNTYDRFTTKDGLATDFVNAMIQDKQGNIWAGTNGGISHYNGTSWQTFTLKDILSTATNVTDTNGETVPKSVIESTINVPVDVRVIFQDSKGNIWIGTNGSYICRYDGNQWQPYLILASCNTIAEDDKGNVWFGLNVGGAIYYDGNRWRGFPVDFGYLLVEQGDNINIIYDDRQGNLWFGGQGLARYDGTSVQSYPTGVPAANYPQVIFQDTQGNIWVANAAYPGANLSRYDGTKWDNFKIDGNGSVFDMTQDTQDNIWIGTDSGGVRYDGTNWQTFTAKEGLAGNNVKSIIFDDKGMTYIGTQSGISRYDGKTWQSLRFATIDNPTQDKVTSIFQDDKVNYWFGTEFSINRYDGVSWRTFTTKDELAGNLVESIIQDNQGKIWVGTNDGLSIYDGAKWQDNDPNPYYWYYNGVNVVYKDGKGNIWAGDDFGIRKYDGTNWNNFFTNRQLAVGVSRAVTEDRQGNIWIGGNDGVSVYNGTTWTGNFTSDSPVLSLAQDNKGNIWAGKLSGASRYDGKNWVTIPELGNARVNAILVDKQVNLWFGTDKGIIYYNGRIWHTYTTKDGLPGDYISSIIQDNQGNIWFGTSEGTARFIPK